MNTMKSGNKTSEFWLSIAGVVSLLFSNKLGVEIPAESVATMISVIISTYTGARAWAKKK